ncbi:DUF4116 domain-containing protein [Providencia alcalifaciens]|uniref:DUF4116 domain-containing protein n=1 Tax=Providencia alcalifaciens TaxID=126385 RepID=UPI0018A751FF|nr:DUF4116 domain-containing protein [Providencia alcalifaciens]
MDNSANNSEKNGVVAKISGVFNRADLPTVSSRVSMDENRAACLITKCLRQVIANKSYNHMFQNGVMWSERAEGQTELGFRAMQKLSSENIRQLFCELAPLVQEEIGFLDNLLQMPFTATHASDANIVNEKGILSLFSRKKLEERGIEFDKTHSEKTDINRLSNDDFVFFSLEPGFCVKKNSSRFGDSIFRVDFDSELSNKIVWGSLQEQLQNKTNVSCGRYLKGVSKEADNILSGKLITNEKSMFLGCDFKIGIGLSLIKLLRELPEKDKKMLLTFRSEMELNQLINGIYRPEMKVPRHFFSENYTIFLSNGVNISYQDFDDKEKMLHWVKANGQVLRYASERLKNDEDLVLAALSSDATALKFASFRFRDSEVLVLSLIKKSPEVIKYISIRLQNDHNIVKQAIIQNGLLLQFVSDKQKNNVELVKYAIKNNGHALEFAADWIKNNKEMVLLAVQKHGYALKYASENLKDNVDVVLAAVRDNGYALEFVSNRLKDNLSIVLTAIENSSFISVLQFASERLRNNREVVLAAVKKRGVSLKYASVNLKNDFEIVSAAVKSDKKALMFVSDEMKRILPK